MKDSFDEIFERRPARERGGAEGGGAGFDEADFAALPEADAGLKSLLESWQAPAAPASLRSRLLRSYRQQIGVGEVEPMKTLGGARFAYAGARAEYRPTILEDESLLSRLLAEVRAVARESELTWPEFKRDPLGFASRSVSAYGGAARRALARENVAYGVLASFAALLMLVSFVVASSRMGRGGLLASNVREELIVTGWVDAVPKEQPEPESKGAGMAKAGDGGGMKKERAAPGGGGGGGRAELKPASAGKLPQATLDPQVLAPDPKPPVIQNPSLPTAATIRADPTLFPPDTRNLPYGDPKSQATELSSGPGKGGGIGDGNGGGVGTGDGSGYGPGRDFNTGGGRGEIGGGGPGDGGGGYNYGRVHRVGEVTRKAQIISKPEPLYTEEARKNQITGTVMLRLVLNANGTVSNVTPVTRLPDGLTEKAIEAARRIQFTPAERDGRKVSQYATIQYNFNIY